MSKYTIEIKISDIQVEHKYFSFNYTLDINGTPLDGTYSDSHNRIVEKDFHKFLKQGYAEYLILSAIEWETLMGFRRLVK